MKRRTVNPSWIVTACLALWGLTLLLLVSPGFTASNGMVATLLPLAVLIATLLAVASAAILISGSSTRSPKSEKYTHSPVAKILATLVVTAIVVSTAAAIESLGYNPLNDNFSGRFVYENIATGFGFTGIAITICLSALQKDIYWVTRKKTITLDERQLQERRIVFETSYKLSVAIVLLVALWLYGKIHDIPALLANTHGSTPSHLYWVGINLMLTLLALPLVVAAWKKT